MSLYDNMEFEVMDSLVPPRNRFDDLAEALRNLPGGKAVRVQYDENLSRSSQRAGLRQGMLGRGLIIIQSFQSDGIYITVEKYVTKEAILRQALPKQESV